MDISINFQFTEQAITLRTGIPNDHFSYVAGAPFPDVGDHIELPGDSGIQVFQVVERVFTYRSDSIDIRVLLDLPAAH
ncbi:hypothetical protein [Paraburkholderia sp. RL17-337-BIB-A]|uniref:hypothetical protein n=1 Tax=Paraburkholderia sp. RL17-337-BIB-A TaxID=3031636 RepID=UPI0038BCE49A